MILINIMIILIICFLLRKIHILKNNYNNLFEKYNREKHSRYIREEIDNEYRQNKLRIKKTEVKLDVGLNLLVDDILDIENSGSIYIYSSEDIRDVKYCDKYRGIARIETSNYLFRKNCVSIERLGVDEEYRHKYIGTFLVKRAIEWAKLRDKDSIYLNACGLEDKKSSKPLKEFYRKCGFIDTREDKYNMVLHLKKNI
ncbi:hypothetical protein GCM10008904_14440 [Paraclostridium ghonii]|uniref:GNAT superfamily N-acetyltransferase n=1 Tax=Paraclostridium ghonii TaxID=29358 RepID=A0ABU0MZU6_9FIRM|nr:GNAT family N-acetyltransferase [Paeniclostridium ghonii]MDQ0556439.1 GNAT superfamily N-acetyltransferase [Paeniclostridium ghonii]